MNLPFTVAVCHLNQGPRIAAELDRIIDQLRGHEASLLLVDNGSSDGSPEIFAALAAREPRFRWFVEPRRGVYYARRAAILAAQTPFLIFLDDDARPQPEFFDKMMAHFTQDPRIGVVGGRVDPIWPEGPPDWLPEKLANEFAADPGLPRSGVTEAEFPCLPTGAALGLRLGGCARLFAGDARAKDYPLGRRAGDAARGIKANDLGGEDSDLSMIYAANGWRVIFDNEARVSLHVPVERLDPAWFVRRYFAEGRTRIRLLRISGRPVLGRHSAKHLAAIAPLAPLVLIARMFGPRASHWLRAYFAKSAGAWFECLFGWRGAPFPFQLREDGAAPRDS